jgi:hypothetical protein
MEVVVIGTQREALPLIDLKMKEERRRAAPVPNPRP